MDSARILLLGWTPVRGTLWHEVDAVELDGAGIKGDRAWSAVDRHHNCLKAAKHPELLPLRIPPADLPTPGEETDEVRYWDRVFPASVHGGDLAHRLTELVGKPTLLAHTSQRPSFIWGSPLSVICLSDLVNLPRPLARYRANIIVDDVDDALRLDRGVHLQLGDALIRITEPIDRCIVIEHDPATGVRDERILKRLAPKVELGWGAQVLAPASLRIGDQARLR